MKTAGILKKVGILLALALLLTGGALGTMSAPSQAQVLVPGPPPTATSMAPWVGPNTPWTFYNGDWFNNGILYYFFGPKYGWAPYYTYAPVHIARPAHWYGPKWNKWYRSHPAHWKNFRQAYPYWHDHRVGHRYDEGFYNRYHHGKGRGWQKGYYGEQ